MPVTTLHNVAPARSRLGKLATSRYHSPVIVPAWAAPRAKELPLVSDATTEENVQLNDVDIAYLLSVLRDYNRPQPISTQQLIDELRTRTPRS